jgi:phosphate transport system permease protein
MAVEAPEKPPTDESAPRRRTEARESSATWPMRDRIALALCWTAGIGLCAIAASITLYMLVKGISELNLSYLTERPRTGGDQTGTGGFFDPIVGTVLLATIGTLLALPIGVAAAIWLSEYGRPSWLARSVESGIEILAGTPSIVFALFGLTFFGQAFFYFLSPVGAGALPLGRSFFIAGFMMSFIALPLVVGSTREALQAIPGHVREASYALGKTKAATIRRVLIPSARPGIATGGALGLGRIAGDTAIVVVLLGATLTIQPEPQDSFENPSLGSSYHLLRGTGSTLTSYVYNNAVGEGNSPEKAYAAAFVLLVIVLGMTFIVDLISRKKKEPTWIGQ